MHVRPAAMMGALALSLAGCQGDPTAAPLSDGASSATSLSSPSSRPSAEPSSKASTRPSRSATAGAPEAEDTRDGVVYGYIESVAADGRFRYDKVDYLSEPCFAAEARGADLKGSNQACFRNVNPRLRLVRLSDNATVTVYTEAGSSDPVGAARLGEFVGDPENPIPPGFRVWAITLKDGLAVSVDQFPVGVGEQ